MIKKHRWLNTEQVTRKYRWSNITSEQTTQMIRNHRRSNNTVDQKTQVIKQNRRSNNKICPAKELIFHYTYVTYERRGHSIMQHMLFCPRISQAHHTHLTSRVNIAFSAQEYVKSRLEDTPDCSKIQFTFSIRCVKSHRTLSTFPLNVRRTWHSYLRKMLQV